MIGEMKLVKYIFIFCVFQVYDLSPMTQRDLSGGQVDEWVD